MPRKPPEQYQYKPGHPPTSTGRPKGLRTVSQELFKSIVEYDMSTIKSGEEGQFKDAFIRKYIDSALKGGWAAQDFAKKFFQDDILDKIDEALEKEHKRDLDFQRYRINLLAFDEQKQVLMSWKNRIALMCGRRGGKTDDFQKIAVDQLVVPNSNVLYIGKTITTAIEQMWNGVIELSKYIGLSVKSQSRTNGIITFENGSTFYIAGNNSVEEREKKRGFKFNLVIIDECQSQAGLYYLINDIIEPCLRDVNGKLILGGTGPRSRGTYWEQIWNDPRWTCFNWNMSVNPFIVDHETVLQKICQEKGLMIDSPLIQREYLGKIVYDDDALVFRLTEDNYFTDESLNTWMNSQPKSDLRVSMGLDLGYNDSDAFSASVYSISKPEIFIVYEYKGNRLGTNELAEEIKKGIAYVNHLSIPDENKFSYIFTDTGGLGKKVAYDLNMMYNIPTYEAYKYDKDSAIETLQEIVRRRHLKVRQNGIFADESMKIIFGRNDNDELTRMIDDEAFHPDMMDSILYNTRPILMGRTNA